MRIVSLEPSITATLVELGLREHLVAVTRYCNRLIDPGDLPQLETTWSVKSTQITVLEPDVVIAASPFRAGKIDELLEAGLDVLCLSPRTLADIYHHIRLLGAIGGVPQQAEQIVSAIQTELAHRAEQASGGKRVFVEIWPRRTAERWVAEIIEAMGHTFIGEPNTELTDDQIRAADPEVFLLAWAGVEHVEPGQIYEREGWGQIAAVRERRVVPIDEITINAPGPNLREGIRQLWEAVERG